jgi:hypothetical protein
MALKKEIVEELKAAGFIKEEIDEINNSRTPSNQLQDLSLVVNSAPFKAMIESRIEWWKQALSPKSLGGFGLTEKEGRELIKKHYAPNRKRKKKRSVYDFLKIEYRSKDKIKSRKLFDQAVITKSKIVRDMGIYGKKLSLRHSPQTLIRCQACRGTGSRRNIYGQNQLCTACGGTGVQGRKFL